jgi:diguanylate cyclase (GGDEF)-like protein
METTLERDPLTNVPSRSAAIVALREALGAGRPASLIAFGLDNFRLLNARLGSDAGDEVLAAVAGAFERTLAPAPVFRLDGDVFGVLVDGTTAAAEALADRLLAVVRTAELGHGAETCHVTMGAGIAALNDGGTPGSVLLEADLALAAAKEQGRGRSVVYAVADRLHRARSMAWGETIRAAIGGEGFLLHGQPVVDLRSGATQWELLLRLRHDGGQLLGPRDFLPVAERFGLAEAVDGWVLEQAVDQVSVTRLQGRRLDVEVNISMRSLASDTFYRQVQERTTLTGIDPSCLVFEVSEAEVADVHELRHWVLQLRELGCRFALDNFGSASGALTYLKHLPLDFVKIDGDFIRHLAEDRVDQRIVRTIVELGHDLGMQVVAVHVGDEETLELVRTLGVDLVQGFHVGRPIPVEDIR